MKHLINPESNLLFTTTIYLETTMEKLNKKFEDKEISAENYINARNKVLLMVKEFSNELELTCKKFVKEKRQHIEKRRSVNAE
ncbi:MAG: hypothetical protein EOM55_04320 [Clostridia bacterium]|nr:hypothetical protein [Clostridia bacterium]